MFIRESEWERIRDKFTESDKRQLRAAINGTVICPPGWSIDTSELKPEIKKKLRVNLSLENPLP